ncbi:hypothetical protein JB92DRAFT_1820942 [Gautieria morchelliformis]|nr:hypothetical protein JB92DRAFT_1820942 [Gautieria morchelliformis]
MVPSLLPLQLLSLAPTVVFDGRHRIWTKTDWLEHEGCTGLSWGVVFSKIDKSKATAEHWFDCWYIVDHIGPSN